jgi:tRNA-2-methylthio-N6-dimethylallyladenosine synthase
LLEQANGIDGIERIRFTTSNPYNLTARLMRAIREVPKVVEYLHLPLQSGSDRVLERMHRGYTRARYLELIAELKETVPGIALSTDLIVGFPGETDEDVERTVETVERVGYDNVFAFRYSRRPGTPAAAMPDQIPEDVKARRNTRIIEVATRVAEERSRALRGRAMEILVDGASRRDPREASGRTRCNRVVNFDAGGRDLFGAVVAVRITEALPHSLRGEWAAGITAGPAIPAV